MGGAKSLLNFFIKIEDDSAGASQARAEEKETKKASTSQVPRFATTAPGGTGAPIAAIQEDAEIKQQLTEALEQANQSGYDYFELAKAVEAQAAIIPSEALRFQSTFTAVASMGVTPATLVSSAQFYLSVLKKKEDEFAKTVDGHTAEAVTSRENEVKKIDADMQVKSEQIKKMTEEINAMQQQKTALINEVSTNRFRIEQVKNNFAATMGIFVDRITTDIEKIRTYLGKNS